MKLLAGNSNRPLAEAIGASLRVELTKATVQGLNLVRRHTKQTASQDAGIFTKEAPIHLSNLAIADANGKPSRVGFKINTDGTKVRVAKSTGDTIDG